MNLSQEFTDAVMSGNEMRVRIMMKDAMLLDPSMKQFDAMLKYASENMNDIYDEHDGEELITDKSKWDKSYMNDEMVAVVDNFSKERIRLLKNIVTYLYMPEEASSAAPKKTAYTVNASRNTSKPQPEDNRAKNPVGMGLAVAGAAAAVAGVCASKILVAAGGAAVAAAGIVNIIMNKEDN